MSLRRRFAGLIALVVLLLLQGCGSFAPYRESEETQAIRRAIVLDAVGQIGRPYRYGGTTPDGFDCSGLTQYVYAQSGVKLPRSTREQHRAGKVIDLDEALPGDLLFYRFDRFRGVDHVAIYLGDGEAVHAPAGGRKVIVARVGEPWWTKRFVDAVRILE